MGLRGINGRETNRITMSKTDVPSTSKEAYKLAKLGLIDSHKQKILEALAVVGIANYEVIAAKAGIEKHACMRRLSELEREQKVYKPGTKSKTKTDRQAYDYALTSGYLQKTETKTPYSDGQKTAAEYAGELIKSCKQPTLF